MTSRLLNRLCTGTLVTVLLLYRTPMAFAETYYVSESGNDNWSGTCPDSAFATLQHGADVTEAGDSVLVYNGTYAGFDLREGGTSGTEKVFKTLGNEVWIDENNPVTDDGINIEEANWVIIDGFNLSGLPRNGVRVAVSDNVTVRNCYCENCYERGIFTAFAEYMTIEYNCCTGSVDEHGIYHSNSGDYPVIRFNVSHNNNGCGIHMNGDKSAGGDGIISHAQVYGNIVYENGAAGGSGINCDGVVESDIYNNLLYMNHSSGISLFRMNGATGSHHVNIYNNIVVQPDDGRWAININTGSTHAELLNNIVLSSHSYRGSISIDQSSLEGFQSNYNLVENRLSADNGNTVITLAEWQSLGYDLNSAVCSDWNKTFVNYSAGDYHHNPLSQAVDSGTDSVQEIVTEDMEGVARPQGSYYDLGCYEIVSAGTESEESTGVDSFCVRRCSGSFVFSNLTSGCTVTVFDSAGRIRASGDGTIFVWNTSDEAFGIYLYMIESPERSVPLCGKLVNIQ